MIVCHNYAVSSTDSHCLLKRNTRCSYLEFFSRCTRWNLSLYIIHSWHTASFSSSRKIPLSQNRWIFRIALTKSLLKFRPDGSVKNVYFLENIFDISLHPPALSIKLCGFFFEKFWIHSMFHSAINEHLSISAFTA